MALTRDKHFIPNTLADANDVESEFDTFLTFINNLIHKDGSVKFTGTSDDLVLNYANPTLEFEATETDGKSWRLREKVDTNKSYLCVEFFNVSWTEIIRIPYDAANETLDITCAAGVEFDGDLNINKASPHITFTGTEGSAQTYRILESAGELILQLWYSSAWRDALKLVDPSTAPNVEVSQNLEVVHDLTVGDAVVLTNGPLTVGSWVDKQVTPASLKMTKIHDTGALAPGTSYGTEGPITMVATNGCHIIQVALETVTFGGGGTYVTFQVQQISSTQVQVYWQVDDGGGPGTATALRFEVYELDGDPADH